MSLSAVLVAVPSLLAVGAGPAAAASAPTLAVSITQTTGTPAFDADDAAGHDSSETNDIVRTNDLLNYNVEVRYENGDGVTPSANTTFTVELPRGTVLDALPPFCTDANGNPYPGSALTPPADDPQFAPAVPLTGSSWTSLPVQTLTCNVGQRQPGTSTKYPFSPKVIGWVPNGTQLDPVLPTATNDEITTPVPSSNQVQATVSAAPKWELSKNGANLQEDTGPYYQARRPCTFDASQPCIYQIYPILLSSLTGGKGSTPLQSPITFTDDLTPSALWGAAGAGITDLNAYGARLANCTDKYGYNSVPGGAIGEQSDMTAANSVRDSGTTTCSQPGGPGTPVTITITDADTSLFTVPTQTYYPANRALPGDAAYAVSTTIAIEFPVATINQYGTTTGSRTTLETHNEFTDLTASGLDGSPQPPTVDEPWNNYRDSQAYTEPIGGYDKFFTGIPGAPGNTDPVTYEAGGWGAYEGPPGDYARHSGSIPAASGQEVISMLHLAAGSFGDPKISAIACDTWDTTKLQLMSGDVPASTVPGPREISAVFPSNGEAAWLSGSNDNVGNPVVPTQIQYSDGGGSADTTECASGTWYDDPALVPGNDPVLAAQGIYTAVSRVRAWVDMPPGSTEGSSYYISIHQRVVPGLPLGTKIPNYSGVMFDHSSSQPMDDMLADPALFWIKSTYDEANNSGALGDRLIAAPAFSRVKKYVKAPGAADYQLGTAGVPQVTGGQTVNYRLNPTLNSAAASTLSTTSVVVEDCLPAGQSLTTSTPTPATVSAGVTPAGAGLTCDAGETYVKWDLGQHVPNEPIEPIFLTVTVSPAVAPGTYTNSALVTSGDENNDPANAADIAKRTSEAQVQVIQPAGIKIVKSALTLYNEVNRTEETTKDPLKWQIDFANVNSEAAVSNPDVIDRLPANGLGSGPGSTTAFSGTLEFVSATPTAADTMGLNVYYTNSATVALDPQDPSNGAAGSTTWCDAPAGGSPVFGTGTCPASAAEVTGLRFTTDPAATEPVDFPSGGMVSYEVTMLPTGNAEGDIYTNCVMGRVVGLANSVGPFCAEEYVVASTIGDFVWIDANSDGIQQSTEAPYVGLRVHLEGTDSDGNPVSLDTVTDASGKYSFTGLQSGSYTVTFDPTSLKAGELFTLPNVGDDALDSDGDPATGTAPAIDLGVDADDLTVDQGVIVPVVPTTTPTTTPPTTPPTTTTPTSTPPTTTPPTTTPRTTTPPTSTPPTTTPPSTSPKTTPTTTSPIVLSTSSGVSSTESSTSEVVPTVTSTQTSSQQWPAPVPPVWSGGGGLANTGNSTLLWAGPLAALLLGLGTVLLLLSRTRRPGQHR